MIAPSVIDEILRLLAESSLSQRRIAEITNVSRGTVNAVARGKRRAHRCPWPDWEEPTGPLERCSKCGAMATTPCHACRVRELVHGGRARPNPVRSDVRLGLDLRDPHRRRYEEVRRRRNESADVPP